MLRRLFGPVLLGSGLCAVAMPHMGCIGDIGSPGPSEGSPGTEVVTEDALLASVSGVRRLTTEEYDNVLEDLLGDETRSSALLLPSDIKDPFDNDYTSQKVSQALIESAESLAADASARLLANPTQRDVVVGCQPTGPDDEDCLRHFIETFGRRALRRPLDAEEVDDFATRKSLAVTAGDFYIGVDAVLRALLQHPEFLYRIEIGTPTSEPGLYRLTSGEIATRLSFFLWGSTPDEWLLDLADADELQTAEQVRAAALKALEDPRAIRRVERFHELWLGYETLPFDPEMVMAMQLETDALIERVVFDERLPYAELFRFDETFVSDELATHYGLTPGGGSKPGWTTYGDSGRGGILSHGTFLSNGAKFGDTSPTVRGLVVRMKLLCTEIGDPPPGVDVDMPPPATDTAVCKIDRQAEHAAANCASCHDLMDPIGFGLENYDAQGAFRTHDVGLEECVIDGEGEVAGVGTFRGPAELGELLTGDDGFNRCVVTQLYRYAVGRTQMDDVDDEFIDVLMERSGSTNYRFDDLMLEYVTHDGFRYRREGGAP